MWLDEPKRCGRGIENLLSPSVDQLKAARPDQFMAFVVYLDRCLDDCGYRYRHSGALAVSGHYEVGSFADGHRRPVRKQIEHCPGRESRHMCDFGIHEARLCLPSDSRISQVRKRSDDDSDRG